MSGFRNWIWYDGVNLDTCAFAVKNRSASWTLAGRRGENYKVPGRDGSLFNPSKAFDENVFALSMFAAGANLDGTIPADGNRRAKVLAYLDNLTRLFGSPGLHELIVAETEDYGRRNFIPNPSMENGGLPVVVAENIIVNPSGEYSSGAIAYRRNYVDNPSMTAAGETRTFRRNLARNPRMAGEGAEVILDRNRVLNPSLEVGTRFWRAQSGCDIFTARRKRSGDTWPIAGLQSLRAVAQTTGVDAVVDCTSIPVDAGSAHTFSVYAWNRSEVPQTIRITARWFKNDGTFISASTDVDTTTIVEGVARLSTTATAPANAATAVIRVRMLNPGQGDVMYLDAAMCTKGTVLKDYFDGDTDEVNGLRNRWEDEPGRSISIQYRVPPRGYTAISDNQLYATTDRARRGSQCAKVVVGTGAPAGTVLLRQTVDGSAPAAEGDWLSAAVYLQIDDAMDGLNRSAKVNLACYDTKGNRLGLVQNSGGTGLADVSLGLSSANWQLVIFETGKAMAGTARVVLEIKAGEDWSTGDILYADCVIIENEKGVGDWFDGSTSDDDVFDYSWEDDPHWSISDQRGAHVIGYEADGGCNQYQAFSPNLRDYSMQLQVVANPDNSLRPYVDFSPLEVMDGTRKHTLSAMVQPNRSFLMHVGYSFDGGLTWAYGTSVTPTANVYTRLDVTMTITTGMAPHDVLLRIAWNASPVDGDIVNVDSVIFEATESQSRDWFDGDSGKNYAWEGDPERSVSLAIGDRANGWSAHSTARATIRRVASTYSTRGNYAVRATAAETGTIGITSGQDGVDAELAYAFGIAVRASSTLNVQAGISWFDTEGTLLEETFSDPVSVGPTTHVRATVLVDNPPIQAAVAGPFVRSLSNVAPDTWIEVDAGRFGFGADASYADGNTTGWSWTGTVDDSVSQELGTGVKYWGPDNGVFVQDTGWSTDRTHCGEYITTADASPTRVFARAEKDDDQSRFRIVDSEVVRCAVDVKAQSNCVVQLKFILSTWTGQGWRPSTTGFEQGSGLVPMSTGDVVRLTFAADVSIANGDATHFRPAVYVFDEGTTAVTPDIIFDGGGPVFGESTSLDGGSDSDSADSFVDEGDLVDLFLVGGGGGDITFDGGIPGDSFADSIDGGSPSDSATSIIDGGLISDITTGTDIPPIGTTIRLDSAIMTRNNSNLTYFDGSSNPYDDWLGDPDASQSQVRGPARRIFVERSRAINFLDIGYGTSAEFAVELVAPEVFWEDTIVIKQKMAIPRGGGTLRFDKFEGLTAPINDALIYITGAIDDFRITDVGSGAWFEYSEKITGDQQIELDSSNWNVTTRGGKSLIKYVRASGGVLLTLTPPSDDNAPRLRITADNIGRAATIQVVARRKYQLA